IKAKKNSDYVVVCMHSGGQFNTEPGEFTRYIAKFMSQNGVDLILGTHPHVVQKIEQVDETLVIYSIGNFNISPSSVYLIDENLPDYGIMFHLYLKDKGKDAKVFKVTFSILKMHENSSGYVKTYPVDKLLNQLDNPQEKETIKENVKKIYNKFTNEDVESLNMQSEYQLRL